MAMSARAELAEGNFLFRTVSGFLEGDLEIVAQIRTATRSATALATAEEFFENSSSPTTAAALAKDLAENIERIVKSAAGTGTTSRGWAALLKRGMTVAIISSALLRILQRLVSLGNFLEIFLGLLVARILVRVKLHGLLAIGFLQFFLGDGLRYSEQFVIIFFVSSGHDEWKCVFVYLAGPLETITDAGRSKRPLSV